MQSAHTSDPGKAAGRFIYKGYLLAFAVVTSLFFMWAIANNMNDILIKHFRKALDLSRGQAGFIQFAFYLGYFFMALPAGLAMKRFGYKNGILFGLFLYAAGALLFYPAAAMQAYGFFLFALFVIAAGLTFLETAANPYITVMGDPRRAAQRLNLAQSFNGLGAAIAPALGGIFIFSGIEYSDAELAAMTPSALADYRQSEALLVQTPYLVLAAVVVGIAIITFFTNMPRLAISASEGASSPGKFTDLLGESKLIRAVLAQFFYVGAQVSIWSYFIDFSQASAPGLPEKTAAYYLSVSLLGFMLGRFAGTALMSVIAAERLLLIYAAINLALCLLAVTTTGMTAIVALGLTSVFMSIMFPTIFALGVTGLNKNTELGASLIIMAIIGGALFPLLMGYISEASMSLSVLVPTLCFAVVAVFAWQASRAQ